MQLSCLPVSLYQALTAGTTSLADWLRFAKSLGLDGADLSVAHLGGLGREDLKSLRRVADDEGIRIAILAAYSDFSHPDAARRHQEAESLRRWIAVASDLGAPYIRVTAGQAHPEIEDADAALSWIATGLTACLEDAAAAGVTLLYENHVRGYQWQHNDFTQPCERFLGVLARVDSPLLRVLFDVANPLVLSEDPLDLLARIRPRLGAVHISDVRRRGEFGPTTIGTGVAPIREVLGLLVTSGYDVWLSIEEASRSGEDGFRDAVAFVDRAWSEAGGRPRRGD
jgi:sugar phosphate isomerase/epimerase